jgi:hypothetical protein
VGAAAHRFGAGLAAGGTATENGLARFFTVLTTEFCAVAIMDNEFEYMWTT